MKYPMNATTEFRTAVDANADTWVPANGGTETPVCDRIGRKFLYVFNPRTGRHDWLDIADDTVGITTPIWA